MKKSLTKVKKISNPLARMLLLKDSPFKTKVTANKKKYNRKKQSIVDYDDEL